MANDLISNLKASSRRWATSITAEATKNLGRLKKLIKVSSKTVEGSGKLSITSTGRNIAKRDGEIKNVARAYEYGSGLRSKKSPRLIEIRPRKAPVLAFKWDTGLVVFPKNPPDKYLGKSKKTGKKLFLYVEHPGVVAANSGKGYLKPAIDKVRRQIRKEIPADVRKATLGTFRKAFK